eukprot:3133990-Amphidinium_carterae.1
MLLLSFGCSVVGHSQLLKVHGLVFPPYNADEWAVTNMRTQQQRTGIYKIAATALKRSAPTADALLRS